MENTKITCTIGTTDPSAELGLEVWLDDFQIFNSNHITGTEDIVHEFKDDETDHELRFVMKNKNDLHTKIDENSNIVSDARLTINNVAFDDIELKQVFIDEAVYTHDFNGNGEDTTTQFFGEMGCNGTVSLAFSSPIYIWLLEHM